MLRTGRAAATGLLALLALLAAACGGGAGDEGKREPGAKGADGVLRVVATTGQVGCMVARVGGPRVQVTTLMGPGVDPHLYKASAGDVERLRGADLIAYSGLHLEAKMGEVLHRLDERQPTLAVAEALDPARLIAASGFSGTHDPHVWFDVALWAQGVTAVRDALVALDPDHADGYRARADAYAAELAALDAEVRDAFAAVPAERRVLVTAHDAFRYLGRAYGVDVRGLQGISTATEAGTADVQALAEFIAERRIPALFVESSVSPRAIEAVREAVRARGFDVALGGELFSDSLGDAGTPAGTYVGVVRHNVAAITAALGGGAP